MIKIVITIDDHLVAGLCDATPEAPEIERKCAAILMATFDAASGAMESDDQANAILKMLIRPTIQARMKEAYLQ